MIITVLGASGGVGQATCLLLKTVLAPDSELRMVDMNPATPGIALDLSHIPTAITVHGYTLEDISAALTGSDIVLITAGVPRKPGMTRDDLFAVNAKILADLTEKIAEFSPNACIAIVTNPVNSMLPVAAKVLKEKGVYNPKKLFGVTNLDILRARVFLAKMLSESSEELDVEVIGGHSAETMLPIFSELDENLSLDQLAQLRTGVQEGGTKVVEAKAGTGSATLSMGYAAAEFVNAMAHALAGNETRICAYIPTEQEAVPFFAKPILLGKEGIQEELEYGPLSDGEQKILEEILPILRKDIEKGESFII